MQAKLTDDASADPDWIFERKLDGIRCIAVRDGRPRAAAARATTSRSTAAIPSSSRRSAAERQQRFAVDGEVVAFDGGQTSFARLAQRGERARRGLLYVFDVLWLDGHDVRALPLRARKRLLRGALGFDGPRAPHARTATATARRTSPRPAAAAGRA